MSDRSFRKTAENTREVIFQEKMATFGSGRQDLGLGRSGVRGKEHRQCGKLGSKGLGTQAKEFG